MKNKAVWGICLIILISTIFFFLPKKIEKYKDSVLANLLPEEVVKTYIISAIKGDEDTVFSLVTTIPDSYSFQCENNNSLTVSQNTQIHESNELAQDSIIYSFPSYKLIEGQNDSKDKFLSLSNSNSKVSVAFLEARYIYTTQSAIKEANILDVKVFEDEAIVDVKYVAVSSNTHESRFLLKKMTDGWKLFMTVSPISLGSSINENYAKVRPHCINNQLF